MKPRSGRTIPLYFKVSPEEKELIQLRIPVIVQLHMRKLFPCPTWYINFAFQLAFRLWYF